jgi:hypothetical protein
VPPQGFGVGQSPGAFSAAASAKIATCIPIVAAEKPFVFSRLWPGAAAFCGGPDARFGMNRTILYTEYGVELAKNAREEHFLSVLVGGIGQYEETVMLTPEELSWYREFGNYYIQKLALEICRVPSKFKDRPISKS